MKRYLVYRAVNDVDSITIDQPVLIQLQSSIQHPGQDAETHNLEATGTYIKKAGTSYLKFVETTEGKEIRTTVKMSDDDALILRRGALDMRLPFIVGSELPGTYGNGPASFKLRVKTKRLAINNGHQHGSFNVAYELHAEGALLGTYELTITYTEGTT